LRFSCADLSSKCSLIGARKEAGIRSDTPLVALRRFCALDLDQGGEPKLASVWRMHMAQYQNHTQRSYEIAEVGMESALDQFLAQQSRLCEKLENIADALPNDADRQDCLQLSQALLPLIKRVHDYEEHTVFPWLVLARGSDDTLLNSLDRLKYEHLGDEEFATDLSLALRGYVTDRAACNTEALAWMLRGFFEGMRRHIAFEREHILPLLQSHKAS
jgi:Hemerythrin HHE cation binding domain